MFTFVTDLVVSGCNVGGRMSSMLSLILYSFIYPLSLFCFKDHTATQALNLGDCISIGTTGSCLGAWR